MTRKTGIEHIKKPDSTIIIDHDHGTFAIDFAEGFKLERGERKAFYDAYRKRKAEGVLGIKPKLDSLMGVGFGFFLYFMDRKKGMSQEDALKKHIPI